MFDNKYPYTDFSQLNLDWFLLKFKELLEEQERVSGKVKDLDDTVKEFTDFVTNYFDDLDVQQEINNKLDAMAADGTLSALIAPLVGDDIQDSVTDWLDEHVDPVGSAVVVDDTLSIEGAAADAKETGDEINAIINRIKQVTGSSITNLMSQKAITDNLLILKTLPANANLLDVTEIGAYTFNTNNVTGYPQDFTGNYGWLIVLNVNLKIIFNSTGIVAMWVKASTTGWENLTKIEVFKGSLSNININTANIKSGLYTIAPVATSGITGYPSDMDTTSYHWLLSLAPQSFRLLFSNQSNAMWFKVVSEWFRVNPDIDYANTTGASTTTAMTQKAVTDELNLKQSLIDSLLNIIQSGNDNTYNTSGEKVEFESDDEKYLISASGANIGNSVYYDNANYHVAIANVLPNKAYVVKASTNYGNGLYAIFDANDTLLKIKTSASSGGAIDTVIDSIITPSNASYIKIGYLLPSEGYIADMSISYRSKKWHDIKWTAVGDSLTEVNSRTTKNYINYIQEKTGITCVNMGLSGSGYARKHDTSQAFYDRVANVPIDSDIVTIFGSGNDLSSGLQLGNITDDLSANTLCGFINATIDALQNRFVNAGKLLNLGIITPTPWINLEPSSAPNSMSNYSDAIEAICKLKGVPCLNLYYCSNLHPDDADFRSLAYSKDEGNGVHPDEAGHKLIAPRFESFLASLLLI